MRQRTFFVYIMGSRSGVLYPGVTNNLERRVFDHKSGEVEGFTKRYGITRLLYFEQFQKHSECDRTRKADQIVDPCEADRIDKGDESEVRGSGGKVTLSRPLRTPTGSGRDPSATLGMT
jgi:predicted GIY-YIG superfamily endonuclease